MRLRKSQSIFDFAIALIAISGLIVGIVRIWVWFNANYAKRDVAYQKGRLYAAGRTTPARPSNYNAPIQIGANETDTNGTYEPLDLTEDWVFRGKASGTVSGVPVGSTPPGTGPGSKCDKDCTEQCTTQPECHDHDPLGEFYPGCDCYQACSGKCYCQDQIGPMITAYARQVTSICGPDNNCNRCYYSECTSPTGDCPYGGPCSTPAGCGQACNMRRNADSLREEAKKFDDPWDIGWWGTWGKAAGELKDAADELDSSAKDLEQTAKRMADDSKQLQECCSKATAAEQRLCLDAVEVAADCEANCLKESQGKPNKAAYYQSCYYSCYNTESLPCSDRVDNVIASIEGQLATLQQNKDQLDSLLTQINTVLPNCAASAGAACSVCDSNGNNCSIDPACYNTERNKCCQKNCCQESTEGWGRDCDSPSVNCDNECSGSPCPKCGLSKLASNINLQLQDINTQITHWQEVIRNLPNCCSVSGQPIVYGQPVGQSDAEAQNQCMEDAVSR